MNAKRTNCMYGQTMNNDVTLLGSEKPLLAGRYQVVRQLGAGGMGSVWLAEDRQLDNKLFAVKMLPSILVANKRAYRQLKDEALVAMKLVHPNIVQIRAFEENNGNPFLVMDYIEGQTLDDYLAEKGRLTEDEALRILKPIAAALDYAHGQGVIHRDVKPANVMIRNDGQTFILDFGIAREIQETMTRVTGKLSSGTLLYMSPEQLNGEPPKPAQDVYSFAAMLYECLNGEPPFSRGNVEYQIMNKMPEPLGSHIIISGLVMQGIAKKPQDRPRNCAAVFDGDALRRDAKNITRVKALEHLVASHEKSEEGRRNVDDSSFCFWESFWGFLIKHSCIIIEVRMVVIALLLALVLSAVITIMLHILSPIAAEIPIFLFCLIGLLMFYLLLVSMLRKRIVVKSDLSLYILIWSILSCGVAFVIGILVRYILSAFDPSSVDIIAFLVSLCVFSVFMSWRLHIKVGRSMLLGAEDNELSDASNVI